jgi:uncharacterized membrane protein YheB (UPF0754 family)
MTQLHTMIRETQQATEDGYQLERANHLMAELATLMTPHIVDAVVDKIVTSGMLIPEVQRVVTDQDLAAVVDRRVKLAIDDLNDRDADVIRSFVRDELDDKADDFDNRVNEIIDEREFIDSDDVDDKVDERIHETLRERELVRKDELDDKIAEALGTFAQGDTMREKIQDALADMSGSFTLSRY